VDGIVVLLPSRRYSRIQRASIDQYMKRRCNIEAKLVPNEPLLRLVRPNTASEPLTCLSNIYTLCR